MSISDIALVYYIFVARNEKEAKKMYQFYCEYVTKKGQRCGEIIYARDSIEARNIIKCRPEFARLYTSPKRMN